MAWEPAVLAVAQLLVQRFAPRGTAPATVRCLLSRREPTRLKHFVGHMRHDPHGNSNGAQPDVMSGSTKDAVTIQSAENEGQERVGGLTTSQVD